MNILKGEHCAEAFFLIRIEAACLGRSFRIVISAEDDVPDGKIGVVLRVVVMLVVYAMGFRALEDRPEPTGRPDVPVVEVFRDCGEEGIECGGFHREAENGVGQRGGDQGVDGDLDRVLVETGENFDPPGRVVKLMAKSPEEFGFVTETMPAVVNQSGDEVANDRTPEDGEVFTEFKK